MQTLLGSVRLVIKIRAGGTLPQGKIRESLPESAGQPSHLIFDHSRQFRMANERPRDESASEHYRGRSISRVMRVNNQIVKAAWKEEQLQNNIFPSFERVF